MKQSQCMNVIRTEFMKGTGIVSPDGYVYKDVFVPRLSRFNQCTLPTEAKPIAVRTIRNKKLNN